MEAEMDEKDIFKISLEIIFDRIEQKMLKRKSRNLIYICNVCDINFFDLEDKKIIFYDSASIIKYDYYKSLFFCDWQDKNSEGVFAANFNCNHLAFKFKILNESGEDILLCIDGKKEKIDSKCNKEFFCVINQSLLNSNCFNLVLNYVFSNKIKKPKVIIQTIHYHKNQNTMYYEIKY